MESYTFGIDIGGTAVKLGFFDDHCELLEKWQIPTRQGNYGDFILSDVKASLENILSARQLDWSAVSGIGIAVPGPVIGESFVPLAVNLGWKNVNVRDEMRMLTGVENIRVENDAKAAALGEYRKGGWEAYRNAVMITIGTGVGGAVILDGKIVPGSFGAAGELSHIQVDPYEREHCACGGSGHLQQYVSAEGILRNAGKKLSNPGRPSSLRMLQSLTVKDIFDAARAGDGLALETVRETVQMLARAMAAVSCIIDPELYLIGGGISGAGEFLLDMLRTEFRKLALPTCTGVRIEAAKTGNDAGICGAASLVTRTDILFP